jgi:hypothetical protein
MTTFQRSLIPALALMATVAVAPAHATVLQTQTFNYSQLSSGASIDLFSSSLGTLTSITFSATPSDAYSFSVTNNGASTVTGNYALNANYSYTFGVAGMTTDLFVNGFFDGFLSGSGIQGGPAVAGMFYNSGTINIAASSTSPAVNGTFTNSYSATSTNLALWSDNGPTTSALLTVLGSTPSSMNFTQSGQDQTNTSANLTANPQLTFTITYNGEPPGPPPVPEPASMMMLGTGLLGLGAMLRRRRRRN